MSSNPLSAEQRQDLAQLVENSNQKLETTARASATQAFNLGCSISLLPAALLVALAFILSRGSWLATVVVAVLMLLGMLGFANLVAITAKEKTLERIYRDEVEPQIMGSLNEHELARQSFDTLADELLPGEAAMRRYLSHSPAGESQASKGNPREENG